MKKDESIKFLMVGHAKTVYKAIELVGVTPTAMSFRVYWNNVDDYGAYAIIYDKTDTLNNILNRLLELISDENQESELTQPQKATTLPLLFC